MKFGSFWLKLRQFTRECVRVLKVSKKPGPVEFKTVVKVSGLGMIIIGFIGFMIQIIYRLFFG